MYFLFRSFNTLFIILFISTLFALNTFAKEQSAPISEKASLPSEWSMEKINDFREKGLLPESIDSDYSATITRAEYVTLVIKLFKNVGKNVITFNSEPFTDIENSKYKDDIIFAFNAGMIAGYGNKLFKPDEKIKREEIACLLAGFIRSIRPEEKVSPTFKYNFVDLKDISSWALPYVLYCYEKKVLEGTENLRINPKDFSTREQAIFLVSKLSDIFSLSTLPQKTISSEGDLKIQGINKLPELQQTFGKETADKIMSGIEAVKNDEKVSIIEVSDESVRTFFKIDDDLSSVQFSLQDLRFGRGIHQVTTISSMKPTYQPIVDFAKQCISASKYSEKVLKLYQDAIAKLTNGEKTEKFKETLGTDAEYFEMSTLEAVGGYIYVFTLVELPSK